MKWIPYGKTLEKLEKEIGGLGEADVLYILGPETDVKALTNTNIAGDACNCCSDIFPSSQIVTSYWLVRGSPQGPG